MPHSREQFSLDLGDKPPEKPPVQIAREYATEKAREAAEALFAETGVRDKQYSERYWSVFWEEFNKKQEELGVPHEEE